MSHANHDNNNHNNNNHENNRELFDRLVDGELSDAQRQQFLASLNESEHGWRDCALSFLEAQTWDKQFKQLLSDEQEQPAVVAASSTQTQQSQQSRAGQWLAIAASLLFAFSVGWFAKSPTTSSSLTEPQQEKIITVDTESLPLREAPVNPSDAVTLLVRDTDGKDRRLQVPLLDVDSLDQQFVDTIPEQLRARFRDRGFELQSRRRFAPMFFEQDEQLVPMVVPVDDTYIVPVNRPIY